MDKELTFDMEELVDFIYEWRRSNELHWWVGTYDKDNKHPEIVSESLRGVFDPDKGFFIPLEDEVADCCHDLLNNQEEKNPFKLLEHCMTKEHIRTMLEQRDEGRLESEWDYMLNKAMNTIAGVGEDEED